MMFSGVIVSVVTHLVVVTNLQKYFLFCEIRQPADDDVCGTLHSLSAECCRCWRENENIEKKVLRKKILKKKCFCKKIKEN